jgi:hypothetical protein
MIRSLKNDGKNNVSIIDIIAESTSKIVAKYHRIGFFKFKTGAMFAKETLEACIKNQNLLK